jgi:uncharacterized membrane protein
MPPLAVVGYGLATWNLPVLGGALALFGTNIVTIAFSATIMARFYGFGYALSSHQSWLQIVLLGVVFTAIAAGRPPRARTQRQRSRRRRPRWPGPRPSPAACAVGAG